MQIQKIMNSWKVLGSSNTVYSGLDGLGALLYISSVICLVLFLF